nr:hypothetical protein [Tanacetum cinerariifolium]
GVVGHGAGVHVVAALGGLRHRLKALRETCVNGAAGVHGIGGGAQPQLRGRGLAGIERAHRNAHKRGAGRNAPGGKSGRSLG